MTALFRKLETPALTDIAVDWPAGGDAWPRECPTSTPASRSS